MKRMRSMVWLGGVLWFICLSTVTVPAGPGASDVAGVGIAVRDITPELPIWLAGYAARNKPAERVDTPLVAQALAFRNPDGERFVFVSVDNCEVSREFNEPILRQLEEKHQLKRGAVMIVSSHTHSAPVLEGNLMGMYPLQAADSERIKSYGQWLQTRLVEVIGAALADVQPALLEHGVGQAGFATNRRVYQGGKVVFGENLDGPVDSDVPVLRIKGTNGIMRAIVFGYACHPTSIAGDDFYYVSGDYPAYARQHIEAVYPGVTAMYLSGMGADSNPAPRGRMLDSKRHGLKLAGAVVGVLDRPMRPVRGQFRVAYEELELPFVELPTREQMEKDAAGTDRHLRARAQRFLKMMQEGKALPKSVTLPVAAVRLGEELTFVAMGGEVVVDYSRKFKRMLAADHPWTVGYAYEVPCYIPSLRIIKEGGYEADSSLIYYGFYGPFQGQVEDMIVARMASMVQGLRGR